MKHDDQIWRVNRANDHHEMIVRRLSKFKYARNNHIARLVALIVSGTLLIFLISNIIVTGVITIGMIVIVIFENWKYRQSHNGDLIARTQKKEQDALTDLIREKEKLARLTLEDD